VSAALALAAGTLALYALHRLALWLERRGWLYYRNSRRKSSVWLAVAAAFDPNARRIQEIHEAERLEEDTSGDDPPWKLRLR